MWDINLTDLFQDFYHTRFFVLICLSFFTFLFTLRLDQFLTCSYWIIFTPLWIWKLTALIGMLVGTICWFRLSNRRFESDVLVQFKGMMISFITNLILFLFELIVCEKLDSNREISWSICFIPLFLLSLISTVTCIWSIRYDRSYEMELIFSLNILQFVFISLRLDNTITWSWVIVLIPVWIIMCISFMILIYIIIVTVILTRSTTHLIQHQLSQRTNRKCYNAMFYTIFLFSLLMFEILLTNKLDHDMSLNDIQLQFHGLVKNNQLNYNNHNFKSLNEFIYKTNNNNNNDEYQQTVVCYSLIVMPLYLAYFSLICLSFSSHTGNTWWFGMRRDFCDIFLNICPIFQIYGNVQIKFQKKQPLQQTSNSNNSNIRSNNHNQINNEQPRRNNSIYTNINNNNNNSNNDQTVNLIYNNSNNVSNQASIITLNNNNLNSINGNDLNLSIDTSVNITPNASHYVTVRSMGNSSLNTSSIASRRFKFFKRNINNSLSVHSASSGTGESFTRNFRKSKFSSIQKFSIKSNQSIPLIKNNNTNNVTSTIINNKNSNNRMLNNNRNDVMIVKQLDQPD